MEANTFMMPIGGKSILRNTGEEVEIIDFEAKERGDRKPTDMTMKSLTMMKDSMVGMVIEGE